MAKLSTHVLDTAAGIPAAGVPFHLDRVMPGERITLVRGITNTDGRTDLPLLSGEAMQAGMFELHFDVATYFRGRGAIGDGLAFLDVVTLRFGVAEADMDYHVPLLVSPWSYSSYRGS